MHRFDQVPVPLEPQAGAVVEGGQVDGVEFAAALAQEGGEVGALLRAVTVQPVPGALVQVAEAAHHAPGQALAQVFAEQRMEAVPLLVVVQRHQQQAVGRQPFEDVLRVTHAEHFLAQFDVEAIQHGELQQQVLGLAWQVAQGVFQDGLGQGVEPLGPVGEVRVLALVGQHQHLDAGDPALGGFEQGAAGIGADRLLHPFAEKGLGLALGEAQAAHVELVAAAFLPHVLQAGRQLGARADDQVEVGRGVFHHPPEQFVQARIVDAVVVVEDQVQLGLELGQHVDQHGEEVVQGFRAAALVGVHQLLRHRAVGLLEGGDPVAEELVFLVVGFVQVDPADLVALLDQGLAPLRQQRGLAEAAGGAQRDQRLVGDIVQALQQALAQQRGVVVARWQKFGNQHGLGLLIFVVPGAVGAPGTLTQALGRA